MAKTTDAAAPLKSKDAAWCEVLDALGKYERAVADEAVAGQADAMTQRVCELEMHALRSSLLATIQQYVADEIRQYT